MATNQPTARAGAAMVFDPARHHCVMFGGASLLGALDETWTFDGTTWTQTQPAQSPPAREGHALVYDQRRQVCVLFGGQLSAGLGSDTWEWNGVTWTRRTPAQRPPARRAHALAFDAARAVTVLFGGFGASGPLADTWEWDGVAWTFRTPASAPPAARVDHALTFDPLRARVVLFGGVDANATRNDTWEWDGADWILRVPTIVPAPAGEHRLVFDDSTRSTLSFGGRDGASYSSSLWSYQTTRPAEFEMYGAGCRGTAGTPQLTSALGALPWVGTTFVLRVAPLPATAAGALLLGASASTWNGTSLPLSLGALGMIGCSLRAAPDVTLAFLGVNEATIALPIPFVPALARTPLFTQTLNLDVGANPAGLTASQGLRVLCGVR